MITFPLGRLKAAALAMANKDIRYYLCGVYVEYVAGRTRLVATDGHRCHVVESYEVVEPFTSFILPAATVKEVLKASKDLAERVVISGLVIKCGKFENFFEPVDGTFPEYRRIMTGECKPSESRTYDPKYLLDVQLAIQAAALNSRPSDRRNYAGRENLNARGLFSLYNVPNFAAKVMHLELAPGAPVDGIANTEWSR